MNNRVRNTLVCVGLPLSLLVISSAGVRSETAEAVNVRAYGAKGDGLADDTAGIKSALSAAPPQGRVHFPAGSYRISSEIAVEKSGVILDFDGVTLIGTANEPMLRIGASPTSSESYSSVVVRGRLALTGAGQGKPNNDCLVIRNMSYGHFFAAVKLTNCGGKPFVLAAYRRGVQHNLLGGGWEITGNPEGAWEINAAGEGGYVNDNTLQTIRAHRNGSGGVTHARILGRTVENNTFINVAIETSHATDKLLEIQTGKGNAFIALRLDGISKTHALDVYPNARANIFLGLALDGYVTDKSRSNIVLSQQLPEAGAFGQSVITPTSTTIQHTVSR
jgi:hypothetical protein